MNANLKPIKTIALADGAKISDKLIDALRAHYPIEFTTSRDADYVFHSAKGYDVLKYCGVRIFITGENVTPNFCISDYAMAFEKIPYADRNLWFPLITQYEKAYRFLKKKRRPAREVLNEKSDFCAYVMSNTTDSADERHQIFDLLSAYKAVRSGGRWRNNVGGRVSDKRAFQSKHKFVIAFENSSRPGYLTEKFAEAAASNAIPIYWGDPEIGTLFNPKAFVNCHNFSSLEAAVEWVKEIDQNDGLYLQMLSEPWFPDEVEPDCLKEETFHAFLKHIFDQPLEAAFRRNRSRWGIKKERELFIMAHRPITQTFVILRKKWRRLYKRK